MFVVEHEHSFSFSHVAEVDQIVCMFIKQPVQFPPAAKKINRKWLYVSNWPSLTTEVENQQFPHTDFLYYVIFEYDAWPTGLRTAGIADAGNSGFFIDTQYRSADVYYQKGFIPEDSANFWQLSISGGFWAESWY